MPQPLSVTIEFDVTTGKAKRQITRFNREMKTGLSGAKKAVLGVSTAIAGLSLALIRKAIPASREYSKALAEITTISNIYKGELKGIVQTQATAFGTTQVQQARGLYQTISAGITDATKAQRLLTTANKLAVAGLTDTESSVRTLAAVVNAYGQENITAEVAANTLFSTVRLGVTRIEDLSASIGEVLPIAAQMGVGFDEVAAAIAEMTQRGISTNLAVTSLRSLLVSLQKDTAKSKTEAKRLGIEFNAAGLRAKGLSRFLQDIRDNSKLTETSMFKLFGRVEALKGVLALTEQGGEGMRVKLAQIRGETNAVDIAFAKMANTFDHEARRAEGAVDRLATALGNLVTNNQTVVSGLSKVTERLNSLASLLERQSLSDFLKTFGGGAAGFTAGLATVPLAGPLGFLAPLLGYNAGLETAFSATPESYPLGFSGTGVELGTHSPLIINDFEFPTGGQAPNASAGASQPPAGPRLPRSRPSRPPSDTPPQPELEAEAAYYLRRQEIYENFLVRNAQIQQEEREGAIQHAAELARLRNEEVKSEASKLTKMQELGRMGVEFLQQATVAIISTTIQAAMQGQSIGKAIGQVIGGMLVSLGEALLAQAAVLTTLSFFNFGISAGHAAVFAAAGITAIAAGSAMGGGSGSRGGARGNAGRPRSSFGGGFGGGGGSSRRPGSAFTPGTYPEGFGGGFFDSNPYTSSGGDTYIFHINEPLATERQIGRAVSRLVDRAVTLRVGRRR